MYRCAIVVLLLLTPALVWTDPFNTKGLDETIEKIRTDLEVPGGAVVVVQDDKVIYLKGFGLREQGKPEVITPDTVFAIASCSKAFTATLIAMLVDEGKLSWDDPVRKHLESFRLSDELADRDVTLRDLLCHRTGMPRHDMLWVGPDLTTADLIRQWGKAPRSTSFRSTWEYSNVPFTTAGFIAGRIDKLDWARDVAARLFFPLGMRSSSGALAGAMSRADHATPHYHGFDKKINTVDWDEIDNCGGAGCVNSTARDMGQWLRFQLAGGKIGDKRLLAESALEETHRQQMLVKVDPYFAPYFPTQVTKFPGYGLGWFVFDYRGQVCVAHGGTLSGFRAQCMLLPEKKVGVFVVCNLRPSYFPETVCRTILDRVLGAPAEDWVKFAKDRAAENDQRVADARKKRIDERKPDTKPSRPLKEYTGEYEDRAYGKAEVTLEGDQLKLTWGKLVFRLEHYNFDTFTAVLTAPAHEVATADRGTFDAQFRLGSNGDVTSMTLFGQEFAKAPAKK
jgi:CubicO group peptidase (beta-lactamase class C family)